MDNVRATFVVPNELILTQRTLLILIKRKIWCLQLIHIEKNGNLNLSNPKDYEELENVNTVFLVNRNFNL